MAPGMSCLVEGRALTCVDGCPPCVSAAPHEDMAILLTRENVLFCDLGGFPLLDQTVP